MIRGHIVEALAHATQQVLSPATHVPLAATHNTAFALCYGKFQASAPRVKPLLTQVEARVTHSPE